MLVVNYVHTSLLDIGSTYVYSSFVILLGAAHTTPVGNGPLGPSIGPAPKHTAPLGVSSHAKWPVLSTHCATWRGFSKARLC